MKNKYKEILDFHVVRSFIDTQDQGEHTDNTTVPAYTEETKEWIGNAANPDYDPNPTIEVETTDPVSGNVTLEGFNTVDQVGGDRGFNSIRYDMLRLNKGDVF